MASRGEIAPQKLQEERHTPGRAGGKCATVIVHKLFHAQRWQAIVCAQSFLPYRHRSSCSDWGGFGMLRQRDGRDFFYRDRYVLPIFSTCIHQGKLRDKWPCANRSYHVAWLLSVCTRTHLHTHRSWKSTRELWSFASVDWRPVRPRDLGSSSSYPAWTKSMWWTWGLSLLMYLHKRCVHTSTYLEPTLKI